MILLAHFAATGEGAQVPRESGIPHPKIASGDATPPLAPGEVECGCRTCLTQSHHTPTRAFGFTAERRAPGPWYPTVRLFRRAASAPASRAGEGGVAGGDRGLEDGADGITTHRTDNATAGFA